MINLNEIKIEAERLRQLIENSDKENNRLVISSFPIMSCKMTSMLLAHHLFTVFNISTISGVGGETVDRNGNRSITHYWLEIEDITIDITGDQYNLLDSKELNNEIVKLRPFIPVYVEQRSDSILYKLFDISYRDNFDREFSSVKSSYLHSLRFGYKQLFLTKQQQNNLG